MPQELRDGMLEFLVTPATGNNRWWKDPLAGAEAQLWMDTGVWKDAQHATWAKLLSVGQGVAQWVVSPDGHWWASIAVDGCSESALVDVREGC